LPEAKAVGAATQPLEVEKTPGAFTATLPWRGTYVIEIEHVDAKAGGEGAGAYDRKRFVTSLSFKTAQGLEGPSALPLTVPKRAMTE
jgi:hypothetical protein